MVQNNFYHSVNPDGIDDDNKIKFELMVTGKVKFYPNCTMSSTCCKPHKPSRAKVCSKSLTFSTHNWQSQKQKNKNPLPFSKNLNAYTHYSTDKTLWQLTAKLEIAVSMWHERPEPPVANSDGLINCLPQPGTASQSTLKSMPLKSVPFIKSCVTGQYRLLGQHHRAAGRPRLRRGQAHWCLVFCSSPRLFRRDM